MQGAAQSGRQNFRYQRQCHCEEAFHVGGAAAIETASFSPHGKWIALPILAFHRHHVGVARQDHAAGLIGADGGDQIGLGAIGRYLRLGDDAVAGQIIGDMIDKQFVGAGRYRVESHQAAQHFVGLDHFAGQPGVCHHALQNVRVNSTMTVNSSSRPSSMPADNIHLAATGSDV